MLGFRPRALKLGLHVGAPRNDEQSVRWKQRADRRADGLDVAGRDLPVNGQNQRQLSVSRRSLREEIEVPELGNVVAPELQADRLRHAEAVDVEYPAAHTELGDVFYHRNTLESDRFQMRRQLLGPTRVSFPQLQACRRQCARQLRALEQGAGRRHQYAEIPLSNLFERFNPFAGDLGVRLGFPEALARRVKRHLFGLDEGGEIGQPTLGARDIVTDDREKTGRQCGGEGGDDDCIGRSVEAADAATGGRAGKLIPKLSKLPQGFGDGEQLGEWHGAK